MIGILVDVTRCDGCSKCIEACVKENKLGENVAHPQHMSDGLSANRWSTIVQNEAGTNVRKFCRHCLDPACVSVCPVGAMVKTESGAVVYDYSKCMGCRYCMMACPYGIPRYEWDSAAPRVSKCNLCFPRLEKGLSPACVESCPQEVMTFGDRDHLLQIAHQRINEFPERYLPKVIGETDAGGTSVMYISDIPLDFMTPNHSPGEEPLPNLSNNWLSKVPGIGLGTTGLMTGLFWVIGRRMQAEEKRLKALQ